MPPMWYRAGWIFEYFVVAVVCVAILTGSAPRPADEIDRVRAYTRNIEFDYLSWMLDAARLKVEQGAVGVPGYLDREHSQTAVSDYLQVTKQIIEAEDALNKIYADP